MDQMTDDFIALLEGNQGLPGRYFTDEAILQVERQKIFADSWMCIGLSADAPSKGDLVPMTVLGYPVLIARDGLMLRAFHNVCSHRGSTLLGEPTHGRRRIVCPYHSWTYKLDGDLVATPHAGGADTHVCEQFIEKRLSLRSVRTAEWAGHIFVNFSGTAPAFTDWIRPVAERFINIEWADLRRDAACALNLEVAANWKIIVENCVESYHLPWVHRALNAVNPMRQHYQILGGHSYLGQGGTAYQAERISGAVLPRLKGILDYSRYEALAVLPNLILGPLPDMAFSIVILPEAAERTRERVEFFFGGDEALLERFASARRSGANFVASVNTEDVKIVEAVQRGRHSPAFNGGQLSQTQEATSLQFQKIVAAQIWAGKVKKRPEDIVTLAVRDIRHPAAA